MSDLQLQEPPHSSPGRRPRRTVALVAGAVAFVLVAILVIVLVQPAGVSGLQGGTAPVPPKPSAGIESSAARLLGWGDPARSDEFDAPLGPEWDIYNGVGHNGNGRRSSEAVDVSDGLLTITGDSAGTTAGMAWGPGRKYGRWEGRVRAPASDPSYNALMLLWPDAEDWPEGGEVDFMEMEDPSRQTTKTYLHWSEDNKQDKGEVAVDATQWHNWAVEWTPDYIVCYLDGKEWYRSTDTEMLPPREMHLAIQLDWFPDNADGDVQESSMQVDWVKEYTVPGSDS